MNDNLNIFGSRDDGSEEVDVDELRRRLKENPTASHVLPGNRAQRSRVQRQGRDAAKKRRRRRLRASLVALVVLGLIGAGAALLVRSLSSKTEVAPNYAGSGTTETIIRVRQGDGAGDIAKTLVDAGVIKSAAAYVSAADGNTDLTRIQGGYYKLKQQSGVDETIAALLNPDSRVGQVDLTPGVALADFEVPANTTTGAAATVIPGYISQLTKAACVPLNGDSQCFTADQLWEVAKTADLGPKGLGLVDWAVADVTAAPDQKRRLEGMILPGTYNVPPGTDALAVLRSVITESAVEWSTTNIKAKAVQQGHTTYEMAIIASIVEKEAKASQMPKVASVIDNRLSQTPPMKLQMDSTVNYWLSRAKISTTSGSRLDPTNLYSTYAIDGLPPTPISAPGPDAIAATLSPAAGSWLFFVAVDLQGNSCFSVTLDEQNECIKKARAAGVFDG
ncbi:endolytic transglycosylase MltG [Nakamurella antarctica]|uniref:endolytic transglycosylase MltG n=1 Tax=Nakamurella antarctica TaxID=1902245 RepID=UPI0013DE26D1|nr:endolytic transglycosylase MltG [Nakamurella antarctica]